MESARHPDVSLEGPGAPAEAPRTLAVRVRGFFRVHAAQAAELSMVFVIGVALMQYLYSATPDAGRGLPAALPGNDDFYHLKMALLLPSIGLPQHFDWLQHTMFAERFVSHHYGFHVYLAPFAHLFADPVLGARWAMSVSFGLVMAAATLLLMLQGVGHRWLWLTLMLMLPDDFYVRHAYVRAIDLSLLCLLAGTMCVLRRRYVLLALVLVGYTHVYLGSFFLVAIAGIHWIGQRLRPQPWRDLVRLPVAVALGAGAGLLTHPYGLHAVEFLRTQIFGSGLTPQISVGREWNAYENVWDFTMRMSVPLTALGAALLLRLLRGIRLQAGEWTLLVAALFFLGLTLKARRFVEYWPMFAVLGSAVLAAPVLGKWRLAAASGGGFSADPVLTAVKLLLGAWGALTAWRFVHAGHDRVWLGGAAVLAGMYLLTVVLLPGLVRRRSPSPDNGAPELRPLRRRGALAAITHGLGGAGVAAALLGVLTFAGYPVHRHVRSWCEGNYDLVEIEKMMRFVKEHSEQGDIIFTDDWDIFPVYFYFNDWNRYVAGLDPMFSYRHDAELWERYKLLTRGQAPLTTTVKLPQKDAEGRTVMVDRKITVPLEDIRERYHARFIIVDADHKPFARKLDAARSFVRRIYPPEGSAAPQPWAYIVYEVVQDAPGPAEPARTVTEP